MSAGASNARRRAGRHERWRQGSWRQVPLAGSLIPKPFQMQARHTDPSNLCTQRCPAAAACSCLRCRWTEGTCAGPAGRRRVKGGMVCGMVWRGTGRRHAGRQTDRWRRGGGHTAISPPASTPAACQPARHENRATHRFQPPMMRPSEKSSWPRRMPVSITHALTAREPRVVAHASGADTRYRCHNGPRNSGSRSFGSTAPGVAAGRAVPAAMAAARRLAAAAPADRCGTMRRRAQLGSATSTSARTVERGRSRHTFGPSTVPAAAGCSRPPPTTLSLKRDIQARQAPSPSKLFSCASFSGTVELSTMSNSITAPAGAMAAPTDAAAAARSPTPTSPTSARSRRPARAGVPCAEAARACPGAGGRRRTSTCPGA